ncbi:MAG TPA: transposase [Armatimonadota bacterium]|jgi:REP element-mobilizing transposase RayT
MPGVRPEVYVHFVWATWDRQPLIAPATEELLYACMVTECRRLGAEPFAIGGTEDHVHLLARLPMTASGAHLMNQVKGVSAHLATHELRCEGFSWQGGYGAFSVCPRCVETTMEYIRDQRQHHATGTSAKELEPGSPGP